VLWHPREQKGCRVSGTANSRPVPSPPLSLPRERGSGTRCAALESSWELSPAPPALPPFLPRPPPRPVRPLPACPETSRPACPLAGGSEGGLAGRRAAGLPGPGHGAPDLGAALARAASEGRRGGRGHQGAVKRDLDGPSVSAALRHAGTVLPRR
jgi:hypothetical protein